MTRQNLNNPLKLIRNALLPIICIYFVFSVPLGIYKQYSDQYAAIQNQPVEENECSEFPDDALIQDGFTICRYSTRAIYLSHSSNHYISEDFTKGINQPPEAWPEAI